MALLMQLLEDADIPDPSAGLSVWWSSTFFADQYSHEMIVSFPVLPGKR